MSSPANPVPPERSDRTDQQGDPDRNGVSSEPSGDGLDIHVPFGGRFRFGRPWVDKHGRGVLVLIGFIVACLSAAFVLVKIWGK